MEDQYRISGHQNDVDHHSRVLAFLMPTGLRKAAKRIVLAEKSCSYDFLMWVGRRSTHHRGPRKVIFTFWGGSRGPRKVIFTFWGEVPFRSVFLTLRCIIFFSWYNELYYLYKVT
ncbi:hypothetical protein JOD43_000933 [Pullulanibacillus pueri]|nr:hypothetical protein [Pullulanibacillus pueri]